MLPCGRRGGDYLVLEVNDLIANVFTGIYSHETGRAQPLRISVRARLKLQAQFTPDTPLAASCDYMDIKRAATTEIESAGHFQLIEAVADHICQSVFAHCGRVRSVRVSIVKLALSEGSEEIGISLQRQRRCDLPTLLDTDRYLDVSCYRSEEADDE